jgi:hypothetical protein
VSRTVHRVFCDRPHKQQHVLASLTAQDDGALMVEIGEAVATPRGMTTVSRCYGQADVDGFTSLTTMCTCGCGVLYDVDVAALMRRDPVTVRRVEPESATGVPYDRRRHNGL